MQRNIYSDAIFDASLDTYETERDQSEARPDEAQRNIGEFGIARPYGWAEDRTRQYSVPLRADWADHVRRQGFYLD